MKSALARASLFVIVIAACKPAPRPPSTKITIRATSTKGTPVEGVGFAVANAVIATTDASGAANVDVGGREGDALELEVRCPAPFRSPAAPLVVRRLAIAGGAIEYTVKCEETRRTLAVVVRAENGPELPILYLGKEIGRTDDSGAATVRLDTDVRDRVELVLKTEEAIPDAHPKNPSATFEPADRDEVKEFAVTLTRDAKRKPKPVVRKGPIQF